MSPIDAVGLEAEAAGVPDEGGVLEVGVVNVTLRFFLTLTTCHVLHAQMNHCGRKSGVKAGRGVKLRSDLV